MHMVEQKTNTGTSLKKKVLIGSLWLYALQGSSTVILLIQTVILGRLLTPAHFGIVGVFLIVSAALESFTQAGLVKALIQRKNIDNQYLNTAWVVSILRGVILFIFILIISDSVAIFFNSPRAVPVIKVLGFSIFLQGLYNPGTVYFSRDFNFYKHFLWQGGGVIASFLVSIPLAFILRNEWAIVWGMLAKNFVTLILSFVLQNFRPRLIFNYDAFSKLFNFGKWLFLSSIIVFFVRQGDKIFVAKYLGETLFGIYVMACRIAFMPQLFSKVLPKVLLPAFSKYQGNPMAIKKKYIDTIKVISIFFFPLLGGLIVFVDPFISIVLGDKWILTQLPIQILALSVGINFLMLTGPSLFNAMGKTKFNFKVNLVCGVVLSLFIYPLIKMYQVEGAALCYLMMALAGFVVWKIEVKKLINLKIGDLQCVLLPLVSTILTSILFIYSYPWLETKMISIFIVSIIISGITYLMIGLLIEKLTGLYFFRGLILDLKDLSA
jgi:lipopolysaccharide exporter